jgi:selenocysteine lyase/cysteine desulfurase
MVTTDIKSLFVQARESVYLDTAAEGLPLARCGEALLEYFVDKSRGTPGRSRLHERERAALSAAARLLGTEPANVALLASASGGLNVFADSLDWKRGDEVVTTDLEFPSGVLTWLRLRDRGVRVRVIQSDRGTVSTADFADAIGPATRVVCVSHVSYKTGTRIPFLPELSDIAHQFGAMLVVDATQSLGRVPVPVHVADFLVASTYKWLLGIHGLAVAYLAPPARERITDGALGWYSVTDLFAANRFESYERKPGAGWMMCGMPNFAAMYALRDAIEFLLEHEIARIDRTLFPLVAALRRGIARLGLELLTPSGEQFASGIVSFVHPACENIAAALEQQGIVVWAGDGRVRASVHLYNDAEDVSRFLNVLESIHKDLMCKSHS